MMLLGIDQRLGPDLLHILASMGHGDTLAIVDGNYPAERDAKRLVRMDGHSVASVLEAVLTIFPIETDVMTGWVPQTKRPVHDSLIDQVSLLGGSIERSDDEFFYQTVKDAFAIVATSDPALYGNIVITKGARGQ
ncbi:MAG: RbsD/FucU domain-containing protein [Gammaproteobacteria bacterium]